MNPALPLIVTPGDPEGIGPEVAARATFGQRLRRAVWLLGDGDAVCAHLPAVDARHHGATPPGPLAPGAVGVWTPPPGPDRVELRALRLAVDTLRGGLAAALTTGPIHKERLVRSGFSFTGHTDLLGSLSDTPAPVMAFVGGSIRVALVTVHLPLRQVADAITAEGVLHTILASHRALTVDLGIARPQIWVCGLNPHAGDGGVLGTEERSVIGPAVEAARATGIHVIGPSSAEACFLAATRGEADLVVAMYHDQGLAPLKAVDFGRSVNWTLGLPFIRTSVDHGTADALVGTGRASPDSMAAAIRLALDLADARATPWTDHRSP